MIKLLLDECVPHGLRNSLAEFETYTVTYMGWSGLKNGELLQTAIINGFDVFITTDKNLQHQQNMDKHAITIVILDVVRLEIENIMVLLPKFKSTVGAMQKHHIYVVD
jgi:predicted nuclease of predicted toxin-antitoxin system